LKIQINDKDEEIDLANGGTMSVLNQPGLTEYSFSFRVPNTRYPFALYSQGYMEAPAFLSHLNKLKISQEPFTFKVIRGAKYVDYRDINTMVSLVNYTITEDSENNGDYLVDVELKEYVKFNTIKIVQTDSEGNLTAEDDVTRDVVVIEKAKEYYLGANDYEIKEGDTFNSIALKFFGCISYAQAIAEHNGMEYTNDPLPSGEVINLNREAIKKLAEKIDEENAETQEEEIAPAIISLHNIRNPMLPIANVDTSQASESIRDFFNGAGQELDKFGKWVGGWFG